MDFCIVVAVARYIPSEDIFISFLTPDVAFDVELNEDQRNVLLLTCTFSSVHQYWFHWFYDKRCGSKNLQGRTYQPYHFYWKEIILIAIAVSESNIRVMKTTTSINFSNIVIDWMKLVPIKLMHTVVYVNPPNRQPKNNGGASVNVEKIGLCDFCADFFAESFRDKNNFHGKSNGINVGALKQGIMCKR